jgi:hypothetical protein
VSEVLAILFAVLFLLGVGLLGRGVIKDSPTVEEETPWVPIHSPKEGVECWQFGHSLTIVCTAVIPVTP